MSVSPKELSLKPLVYFERSGEPAAVLGLSMTFYFGAQGKRERRLGLIKALEQFCQQSEGQLCQYMIDGDKSYRKLNHGERPDLTLLSPMVDEKPDFQFNAGSALEGIASPWSTVSLALKVMRINRLGYLLLTYPLSILDQIGSNGFIRQFATICNDLEVEHAYAGLSPVFPHGVGGQNAACKLIGNTLMNYPGLDASDLNTTALGFGDGIKSINFLTAVSHRLLEKAGGAQAILPGLDSRIWHCDYSNGIIFQAGEKPELGSLNHPPAAYVALGKALKGVRADFNKTMFYDPEGKDHKAFSQRWLSRFDG
ncbi:type VI immunity family protein [Marinibactrum halimedae]|uniref:DUF3396 domain-containing protein n=1 Tax=Marinibactrum halimedae TaxID=1444977 RepID=A0AA37T953_9GAMM|nr:type VI immunity family protein [Marinibactrum halimedae]MCD9460207.1 DUF3396 domain-containing protein [Marinibactrum halimedae]GLS27961.1 hypothetical protein GCM10007877_36800 [Marinibactrum halimedae]